MKLTEKEIVMIETLRGLSEHSEVKFTASFEKGVWECELILTAHPLYLSYHPECPPHALHVDRGVGRSFLEAFNNLDANDVEPVEDPAWLNDARHRPA